MSLVKVDYATLEAAQQDMNAISHSIDEKLDTLRQMLSKLQWDAEDRQAYNAHQASWDAAVTDINKILGDIAAAVGIAKQNYMDTEMSNSTMWS